MQSGIVSTYFLPGVIAIIMFTLGLTLDIRDFRNIIKHPRQVFIGLGAQMIFLPLIAFGIANISGLSPELKVGIMIIAACPGGAVSNLITYFLRGSVSLSVALTSLNSVLILITLPAFVYFSLWFFTEQAAFIVMPVSSMMIKVFVMILVPVGIGMLIRYKNRLTAKKIESYLKYFTTILLAVVYGFVVFEKNGDDGTVTHISEYLKVAPWVFGMNVLGMLTGYLMGRWNGLDLRRQITLSVEVGIQNSALAITIAGSEAFLGNHEMAIPAVTYGAFTFFNAVLFGMIIKKIKPRKVKRKNR
ncbi:MAG: bile acid:sodium symporter family protein [Bacteroidales bacterium]